MPTDPDQQVTLQDSPARYGGYFALDGAGTLSRAWARRKDGRTHIARSCIAQRAICGAGPILHAAKGGEIPGEDLCSNCGRVWESRMKAIELDPWEQF